MKPVCFRLQNPFPMQSIVCGFRLVVLGIVAAVPLRSLQAQPEPIRVFIFAGQSNMVGTHSRVKDIRRFPPFDGLDKPQENVLFSYSIGREEMMTSKGWVALQPTKDFFGPELSFGRRVSQTIAAPIAIIKCASGGTSLSEDWNPDTPGGLKLYPLALAHVRSSLEELDRRGITYRLEGFMWHQGENDMFNPEFKKNYSRNLTNFLASWRRDLHSPNLKFYLGELCTKTIWGMDNRENMYAIRSAQRLVVESDPLTEYVPTSHDAVEIGGDEGLHYHYGTLGQLEHGENYADAYLRTIGKKASTDNSLAVWPYPRGSSVKLFVLAGHRNMEGERAFADELRSSQGNEPLANPKASVAYRYNLGGGLKASSDWEPLAPSGPYGTFGPELSFTNTLQQSLSSNIAILKFTHSGSQINDWTPEGTQAKERNLYSKFIEFIRSAIRDLEGKGHTVELAGVFYHLGENDMAFYPYRKDAAKWLQSTISQSRKDLSRPMLKWYISQQPPPDQKGLNRIDITANISAMSVMDPSLIALKAFDLPPQEEKLVLNTAGILKLGELLAHGYLEHR